MKEIHRRSPGGGGTHSSIVPSTSVTRTFSRRGILRPPPAPHHTHSTKHVPCTRSTPCEPELHIHNTEHAHHTTEHIRRVFAIGLRFAQQLMRTWWSLMGCRQMVTCRSCVTSMTATDGCRGCRVWNR